MEVVEISDENLDSFLSLLGEDLAEDVKRVYYGGIGALDDSDKPLGAFIYELLNSDNDDDVEGRILFAEYEKQEVFDELRDYYSENTVEDEEITLSSYELEEEETANAFVKAGFSSEKKESDTLLVTLEEIQKLELAAAKKLPGYVNSIDQLSLQDYREAVKQILFKGHKGVMDDIAYLPMDWFECGISSCVISGDKVKGLFLIRKTPSGALIPALLFAYGPEFKKNLIYLIKYTIQKALKKYPPETKVFIIKKDAGTKALAQKLLPGKTGTQVFFGTREEAS